MLNNLKVVFKRYAIYGGFLVILAAVAGISFAAFMDKGTVAGTTISTGSADLKLLRDLTLGADQLNIADEIQGPAFTNVHPFWSADMPLKFFNNGTSTVQLTSAAEYQTENDPDDLRQYVYGEFFEWNDANSNGIAENEEIGLNLGRKTITKWKTEGFDLGQIESGQIKPLLLRLSTDALSDTKQGKSAMFDFVFDSIGL